MRCRRSSAHSSRACWRASSTLDGEAASNVRRDVEGDPGERVRLRCCGDDDGDDSDDDDDSDETVSDELSMTSTTNAWHGPSITTQPWCERGWLPWYAASYTAAAGTVHG